MATHDHKCLALTAVLTILLIHQSAAQKEKNKEFIVGDWNLAGDFLLNYHSQWPIRRMIIVYFVYPETEIAQRGTIINLFRKLSSQGISSSFIELPNPRPITALRLSDAMQPPVTCVLFMTPNEATSGFVRAASDSGGMTGTRISWIYIKTSAMRNLTQDIGLRPDTTLLSVQLETSSGTAALQRWTGSNFNEAISWGGLGSKFAPELSNPPNKDLADQRLSVAVFNDPPFVIMDSNISANMKFINASSLRGWLIDVWADLENVLGFKTTFYSPRVSVVSRIKTSVEELQSGRADVVLAPFVVTLNDFDLAEYSVPVAELRFLLPRETASSTIDQFILPFETLLWRATAGMLSLAVVVLSGSYWLGRYFDYEEPGMPIFNFKESLLVVYCSLFAQGHDYIPNSLASRMVILMCYFFGVLVSTVYSAALINKLTLGTIEPPFKSFEGMLDSAYTVILSPDSAAFRLMQNAETGAWKELRERKPYPVANPSIDDCIVEVQKSWAKFTLLESRERVLPRIQYAPENCKLNMLKSDVFRAPGQLMLSKSSPYKAALDQQLISMRGSGRLARMKQRWLGLVYDDPCPKDATLPQFGMDNVILPFLIIGGSAALAAIILALEYAITKWCSILLNSGEEEGALSKLARTTGVRLTKGWSTVQTNIPTIINTQPGAEENKVESKNKPS